MGKEVAEWMRKKLIEAFKDKVPEIENPNIRNIYDLLDQHGIPQDDYIRVSTSARFEFTLKKSGVKLKGLVLDLCSWKYSIATVYDKEKVVCYDIMSEALHELKEQGVKVVQGNIRDPYLPFKDNSFDYLYAEGLPMAPYYKVDVYLSGDLNESEEDYVQRVVSEMIRVTKKKAIICSWPFMHYFPNNYERRIEKIDLDECIIVLNCEDQKKRGLLGKIWDYMFS